MTASLLLSYVVYSYTNGITPGPANICSLGASLRFGKEAALKQWWGLVVGFLIVAVVSAVAAWLVGAALVNYVSYLSWIGAAYILWLAWHVYKAGSDVDESDPSYPTFGSGILVQLTNAKIIISCVAALAGFVLPYTQSLWALLAAAVFFAFAGVSSNLVWLFAGDKLKNVLSAHEKTVNIVMALALVLCAITMVLPA